tara:strand:- start:12968 stop:13333 length:366 start_codon:yes stop_codon:yes gene_type:complete
VEVDFCNFDGWRFGLEVSFAVSRGRATAFSHAGGPQLLRSQISLRGIGGGNMAGAGAKTNDKSMGDSTGGEAVLGWEEDGTYECLRSGRSAISFLAASSSWTATLKRFQKLGSVTMVMVGR